MTGVLMRRENRHTGGKRHVKTDTWGEDRHTKIVSHWSYPAQTQEMPELPEARRTKEDPSHGGLKGSTALPTLGFGLSDSTPVRHYIYFALSHSGCGILVAILVK